MRGITKALMALSLGLLVLGGAVIAQAGATDEPSFDPTAYERTKGLAGDALLEGLGAVRLGFDPGANEGTWDGESLFVDGAEVSGCPPVGASEYVMIGHGDGTYSCVGVANEEQARDVAERLHAWAAGS